MKEKIVTLLLVAVSVLTAQAQVRPFIQGGLGLSGFWLSNAEGTESRFSYHGGIGVEVPFKNSKWSFQPSLILTSKGADAPPEEGDYIEENFRLVYMEMPLDVVYREALSKEWNGKVCFGPYFSHGIGGTTEITDNRYIMRMSSFGKNADMRKFDAGLNVQLHLEYQRYFFGLNWDLGFISNHRSIKELNNEPFPCNYSGTFTAGIYLK